MKSVAVSAGCSQSTVSKALRDDPTIPEATRDRIKQVAREMGYRPHPMVSVLMSQLHSTRPKSRSPIIAAVNVEKEGLSHLTTPATKAIIQGGKQRAEELGYLLEVQTLVLDKGDGAAILRQLKYKGVLGIMILPLPWGVHDLPLDLEGFATVALGRSLWSPAVPQYSAHHVANLMMLFNALVEKGFCRIGFAISPGMSEQVDDTWLSAFGRLYLKETPEAVAPFIGDILSPGTFGTWLKQEKPDVIIAKESWAFPNALQRVGKKWANIPVYTPGRYGDKDEPGVEEMWSLIGKRALEGIVNQIHHNQRTAVEYPEVTLIRGKCDLSTD